MRTLQKMRIIRKIPVLIFIFLCISMLAVSFPEAGFGQNVPDEYEMREHTSLNGVSIKHLVYTPKNISPGQKYPFVIYLHGRCEECVTHERILKEGGLQIWHSYGENKQLEPTFLFAPAGGTEGWTREPRRDAIFEIIDGLIDEFPIDTKRIYILGFSMGGSGTWNYIQYRPGFFAAANPQAIGGGVIDADIVKNTPIWTTIGEQDEPRRVAQLKENVARIRAANGDDRGPLTTVTGVNPRFSTFPETTHGAAQGETQRIPGFLKWFYSHVNDGNIPPVVRFTSPDNTKPAKQKSMNLTVSVNASDSDGEIARVDFSLDGVLKGSDEKQPYEFTFTRLSPGDNILTATAYDNGMKNNTASCIVTIEISKGKLD
ncbi:Ig-like domain-containing protein [Candidatus Latescibacterota bacterium]